jgi:hypothetical protein
MALAGLILGYIGAALLIGAIILFALLAVAVTHGMSSTVQSG